MDDLISRQAAIDMLKNRWKKPAIMKASAMTDAPIPAHWSLAERETESTRE